MKKSALLLAAAFGVLTYANADEIIQYSTLPQAIQTTVVRETRITNPSSVTRVMRSTDGVYAVTVNGDAGSRVIYQNEAGTMVSAPAQRTTTTTTTTNVAPAQPVQGTVVTTEPAEGAVVTYHQVQTDSGRYQLLEKKGNKEVYLDRQTGQKVKVKREDND